MTAPAQGPTPAATVEAARRSLAATLRAAGIDSPDLDARLLVCAACGLDHAGLIRDPDRPLSEAAEALAAFARRRLAGEPVSRILGRREFFGLTLHVDAAVLDPRPETEGLVAAALDAVGGRGDAPLRILDLGTGSGAILCALLAELPRASGVAVDRSAAACRTARRNLAPYAGRAQVICGDWDAALGARFDLVVSNPPYIGSAEIAGLAREVQFHDPLAALDGGPDGMDAYRALAAALPARLAPGGTAALECGWRQGEAVAWLLRAAGLADVAVLKDLAGHDRVITAVSPAPGGCSDPPANGRWQSRLAASKALGRGGETA